MKSFTGENSTDWSWNGPTDSVHVPGTTRYLTTGYDMRCIAKEKYRTKGHFTSYLLK